MGLTGLTAPAPVHHHAGQRAIDEVVFLIEVQHSQGGQLTGCAAHPGARVHACLVAEL